MKKILWTIGIVTLAVLVTWIGLIINEQLKPNVEDAPPLTVTEPEFDYYGWFLVDYAKLTPALERVRTYTNTAFAYNPAQVATLAELEFPQIIYVFNVEETVMELVETEKAKVENFTIEYEGKYYDSGIPDFETAIPGFRDKFFDLYREP